MYFSIFTPPKPFLVQPCHFEQHPTVMKYISLLEEKHLIRTEHTEVIRKDGMKYNGTLRYTITPFREAEEYYHQKQLERLELEAEKRRVQKELAKFAPAGDSA